MEFAVWMFRHAAPEQLAPAAKTILGSLLTLLDDREPCPLFWAVPRLAC